jgi:hypothetical protein
MENEMTTEKKVNDPELEQYDKLMAMPMVDIYKSLANIEGWKYREEGGQVYLVELGKADCLFDPMQDGNQLVALIEKHDIIRVYEDYDMIGWGYRVKGGRTPIMMTELQDFCGNGEPDITMSEAICRIIVFNKDPLFDVDPKDNQGDE